MCRLILFFAKTRWLALPAFLLVFAVCLWGYSYRLSQYSPQFDGGRPIPIAKFLSEKERAGTHVNLETTLQKLAVTAHAVLPAVLCGVLLLWLNGVRVSLYLAGLRRGHEPMLRPWPEAALSAFIFRPPPMAI